MTLYEELDLEPGATDAEIAAAHRAHARKTHPDNGGSVENFARGQRAYEILIDPRRRRQYDETGEESFADPKAAERAEIQKTVSQAIMQLVEGDVDLQYTNIVMLAAQAIRKTIEEISNNKATLEVARDRIIRAAKRFSLKTAGDTDVIAGVLKGRELELLRQIVRCGQTLDVKTQALEVLDLYDYEIDTPPAVGGLDYNAVLAMVKRSGSQP